MRATTGKTLITIAVAAVLLAAAVPAAAEPVTLIRNNGPSATRVDIVVLGDGFTAAEISSGYYAQRVEAFVQGWFAQEPYLEYQNYFNVRRVDVTSNQSGADKPQSGIFRDTAFDATYYCSSIQRLICVDTTKVNTVITNSGLAANQRDLVLVLVNDSEYGGSGGAIAVASLEASAVELILHEVGHSFGLLADEYGGPPPPSCNLSEPAAANATTQTSRPSIKWTAWIDPVTPLPTPGGTDGLPGLYQGAMYCDAGMYRPTYDSKMNHLGVPFYQINTEQHVRRIYNFVPPIDSVTPAAGSSIGATIGQGVTFTAVTPAPRTHAVGTAWRLDGVLKSTAATYVATGMMPGTHQIELTVADGTAMVRTDPSLLLTDVLNWTVTVTGFSDDPLALGQSIRALHIEELRAAVNNARLANGLGAMTWTDASLAVGSTLIRAAHILELRQAITAVYQAKLLTPPAFSDGTLTSVMVRAIHITELRDAVKNLP